MKKVEEFNNQNRMTKRLKFPILLFRSVPFLHISCKEPDDDFYIRNMDNGPLTIKFHIEEGQYLVSQKSPFLFAKDVLEEKKFYTSKKDSVYIDSLNEQTVAITIPGKGMLYLNSLSDMLTSTVVRARMSFWAGDKLVDEISSPKELYKAFRSRRFLSYTYIYDYFKGSVKIIHKK